MAETILLALVRANLVAGAAILLVLTLRPIVLRRLGAAAAYRMWLVVPIAAAACLAPARVQDAPAISPALPTAAERETAADAGAPPPTANAARSSAAAAPRALSAPLLSQALLALWVLGAAALFARSVAATLRLARDPAAGPLLVGVLRPRLVLPADFDTRFDVRQRALVLAHEERHRAAGHPLVNGLVEAARCACWPNPLAHLAAVRVRTDQELACDAAVLAAHPGERRAYAEALLATQLAPALPPLGCAWPSRTRGRLQERIAMLKHSAPGRWAGLAGAAAVAILGSAVGIAAWAQQPARIARPEPVWTPSAEAPAGLLTPIEVQRHDLFIDLARRAAPCPGSPRSACRDGEGIDIVFFGTTNTEMFWWPDRGMEVWRETLGKRKAVNFGSQGTRRESLVWRMQNGELDGYRAKVVVLQAYKHGAQIVDELAPVVAEIRARQPQAKVLIFADFPRGQTNLEGWRDIAAADAAAAAPLVDGETVFWADIGERFYLPDGSHNQAMWRFPPVSGMENVGMQAPAFQAWAKELEPWLERFVG